MDESLRAKEISPDPVRKGEESIARLLVAEIAPMMRTALVEVIISSSFRRTLNEGIAGLLLSSGGMDKMDL